MQVVVPRLCFPFFLLLLWLATAPLAGAGTRTLRVVTYNIDCDTGTVTPVPGLISPAQGGTTVQGGVLEGIGEEVVGGDAAQPIDILALQETTSNSSTVAPIVAGLNAYYNSSNMYALSPYQATESNNNPSTGNGPNALVYNSLTVQLVASAPVDPPGGTGNLGSTSGEYREVMLYTFAPAGVTPSSTNTFYVYDSHYKSGTGTTIENSREGEAVIIRNHEATNLPAGSRVIYLGDYNITTSGEASYQTMLALNAPNGVTQGQGIDPMNLSGATNIDWSAGSNLNVKTESTRILHYRDDFQVMTTNVFYATPGGLAYVTNTYHTFGNNGTIPASGAVTNSSNTSLNSNLTFNAMYAPLTASQLYLDLSNATDHFPVVADYTIPIPDPPVVSFSASPTNGSSPLAVTFTDSSTGASITNHNWAFGDGSVTNLTTLSVNHVYTNAGVYTVTEILSGAFGSGTNTKTISVITPYQAWQVQYFGCTNCSQAQTNADFDGTGQNNLFKYVAGLNPTNPASIFTFSVGLVTNHPAWKTLVFNPAVSGRTYIPQFTTNLTIGNWQTLTNVTFVTNNTRVTITDTNGALSQEFYRINITLP